MVFLPHPVYREEQIRFSRNMIVFDDGGPHKKLNFTKKGKEKQSNSMVVIYKA